MARILNLAMLGNDATRGVRRHTLVRNAPSRNELHLNDRQFHPCIKQLSQEQLAFWLFNFNVPSFPFPALYPSFALRCSSRRSQAEYITITDIRSV